MKTLAIIALVASGLCFISSVEGACPPQQIVNFKSLSEKDWSDLMDGRCSFPIIEFSEGTILPLHIFLKGDLVRLIGGERTAKIEVKQTFYVLQDQGKQLFSTYDMTDWKPLSEFITGTVWFDFQAELGEFEITVRAETNPGY